MPVIDSNFMQGMNWSTWHIAPQTFKCSFELINLTLQMHWWKSMMGHLSQASTEKTNGQNYINKTCFWLFSLHIHSMWETICDAQAGFWLNSKFLSKFSRKPLSGISDQKAPPPNEKLQIWDDQSLLWNTPQMKNFRFEMTKVYSGILPPPQMVWNSRKGLSGDCKVYSRIPPPPVKWKTSDLRWPKFTPESPPPRRLAILEIVCGD